MTDLTAIDVLINPDDATIARAREVNKRMLESLPQGWALDDTHKPHITTLQRYVRTADLEHVYDAVEKTVADTDMTAQIGEGKYLPHLTVGAAKFEDLKVIEAEPFEPSDVHAAGVAVYHLGNNGTARVELKSWQL